MPNNLAVLHAQTKNYAEARRLLEETLASWATCRSRSRLDNPLAHSRPTVL
jgi:Tetratricopeptide repeat